MDVFPEFTEGLPIIYYINWFSKEPTCLDVLYRDVGDGAHAEVGIGDTKAAEGTSEAISRDSSLRSRKGKWDEEDAFQTISSTMNGPVNINIKSGQEQKAAEAPLPRHKRAAKTVGSLMNVERKLCGDILFKDLNVQVFY